MVWKHVTSQWLNMHLKKAIKEQEIIIMQQCLKPYAFTNSNGRINYYYLEMENLMKDFW